MPHLSIFWLDHRLEWNARPMEGALTDCRAALDQLLRGEDVRLSCPARVLHESLGHRFQWVRAAGGWVEDDSGRLLLIRREGRWDLPKGMVECGETLAAAAAREVEEETGVTPAWVAKSPCAKSYHIYDKYGGWHLKQTSWFRMTAEPVTPMPQQEEDIETAQWVPRVEWEPYLAASYASIASLAAQMEK